MVCYRFFHSHTAAVGSRVGIAGLLKPLLPALVLLAGAIPGRLSGAAAVEVPTIKGDLGPCSADFTVVDTNNKPIYDSKIHVTVLYGFMSKRKTDLEIGTNSDGKARIEGLPDKLKKPPLELKVQAGDLHKTVTQDPAADCHASFNVQLGGP